MKISVDISLYPLNEDFIPVIDDFISRMDGISGIDVVKNDLSTQLFGDYDQIMDLLKVEFRRSWETFGKGIFVAKFLLDDIRPRPN